MRLSLLPLWNKPYILSFLVPMEPAHEVPPNVSSCRAQYSVDEVGLHGFSFRLCRIWPEATVPRTRYFVPGDETMSTKGPLLPLPGRYRGATRQGAVKDGIVLQGACVCVLAGN